MKNKAVAIFLAIILTGALATMYNTMEVGADGPIYIRPDGSVDPPTAPIQREGDVYTFTGNIYEPIVIQIDNITVDGNDYLLQGAGNGTGFDLSNRNNVTIKKTHITEWDYGVRLHNRSSGNVIENNSLTRNVERAIFLSNSTGNTIRDSTIVINVREGIFLWQTNTTTITGNNVSNNGEDGISIAYYSFDNTITNNTVADNFWAGISIGYEVATPTRNTIAGNNIANNVWAGIYIDHSSGNRLYHNNLYNNTAQVITVGATSIWDDGYPSGGNFWGDYAGQDLDGDGIGDTPYVIDENNQDNYPFMNPWTPQAYNIAIVNVTPSKTVVGQGYSLHVNVTVTNQGSYVQTFSVTAYANITIIETVTATLESSNSTTLAFTWNTTGVLYGKYVISAYATPVPGEVNTTDNTLEDGTVFVTILGDIRGPDGVPDGVVDMWDFGYCGLQYGQTIYD